MRLSPEARVIRKFIHTGSTSDTPGVIGRQCAQGQVWRTRDAPISQGDVTGFLGGLCLDALTMNREERVAVFLRVQQALRRVPPTGWPGLQLGARHMQIITT